MSRKYEEDLILALQWMRDIRAKAYQHEINPWAFRQALIMCLEIDTKAALERGIFPGYLEKFDAGVRADVRKWSQDH